jgi:hypothetical protein
MIHSGLLREEFFGLLDQVCVWAGLQQLNGFNPIGSQEVAAHRVSLFAPPVRHLMPPLG